jgi:hypothetical protein
VKAVTIMTSSHDSDGPGRAARVTVLAIAGPGLGVDSDSRGGSTVHRPSIPTSITVKAAVMTALDGCHGHGTSTIDSDRLSDLASVRCTGSSRPGLSVDPSLASLQSLIGHSPPPPKYTASGTIPVPARQTGNVPLPPSPFDGNRRCEAELSHKPPPASF